MMTVMILQIQAAIDSVSNLPIDNNGLGRVLIKKGKYYLNNSLIIDNKKWN